MEKPALKIRTGAEIWLLRKAADGQFETLLLRKLSANYPAFWQPPTGGTEPGETFKQTAVRETREETGLEIAENQLVVLRENQEIWLEKLVTLWQATVFFAVVETGSEAVKISDEHDEFGWFSLAEAAQKLTWPGNQENLERLKSTAAFMPSPAKFDSTF